MSEDYQNALHSALSELAELMTEREVVDIKRDELDRRIFRLREGLFGLAILCGTDTNELAAIYPDLFPDLISPDVGLTDAVRKALDSKRTFASPVEVRDRLQAMGYDITKYKNILASIHTILKRLADNNEVEEGKREGKIVYRWNVGVRVHGTSATVGPRAAPGAGVDPKPKGGEAGYVSQEDNEHRRLREEIRKRAQEMIKERDKERK